MAEFIMPKRGRHDVDSSSRAVAARKEGLWHV
jgi:hypothetical protein